MTKVFVYGTLRKGECNHWLLADARFIGEAVSLKWTGWLTGRSVVPFLSETGVDKELTTRRQYVGRISGELYDVDAKTLERLDQLEGHPHHYERKQRRFRVAGEKHAMTAWVYLVPHSYNRGEAPHEPTLGILTFPRAGIKAYRRVTA